jgi:hypothetical protein
MATTAGDQSGELKRGVNLRYQTSIFSRVKNFSSLNFQQADFRFLERPALSQHVAPAFGERGAERSPGYEVFGSRACGAFRVRPN